MLAENITQHAGRGIYGHIAFGADLVVGLCVGVSVGVGVIFACLHNIL